MSMSVSYQATGLLLTALVVGGGGVAAYVDVKSDIAVVETKVDSAKEDFKEQDRYGDFLQRQIDKNKNELTKAETKQEGYEKDQARMERTMDAMLLELKKLNENIIKMNAKE